MVNNYIAQIFPETCIECGSRAHFGGEEETTFETTRRDDQELKQTRTKF